MEISVSFKPDKNNVCFTQRPMYVYGNIKPNTS